FVRRTGVDVLAPAVGTMHGMLKSMVEGETKKHVDPARIAAIKRATGKPLTLHGGSGTDDQGFLDAIEAGITIVHINTELRVAWRRGLESALAKKPDEVVPYKLLPDVVESVKQVVYSRLRLFNASGYLICPSRVPQYTNRHCRRRQPHVCSIRSIAALVCSFSVKWNVGVFR
ncbi:MAG: class II fructose-bisphosphate aldolase, partial [Bryobacteraceae bacterium]